MELLGPLHRPARKPGLFESTERALPAPQAGESELPRAHCPAYVNRFLLGELTEKEMRTIGFPWSEGLVRRSRASAGGTLAATRALFEWDLRITANIAGMPALYSLHYATWSEMVSLNSHDACARKCNTRFCIQCRMHAPCLQGPRRRLLRHQ